MRLDQAKDCVIRTYLETSSEYSMLVQFETRSRERIAVLRTSSDQPSGSQSTWEIWSNTVDYRIPGVPLSSVEQQETHRKDNVK